MVIGLGVGIDWIMIPILNLSSEEETFRCCHRISRVQERLHSTKFKDYLLRSRSLASPLQAITKSSSAETNPSAPTYLRNPPLEVQLRRTDVMHTGRQIVKPCARHPNYFLDHPIFVLTCSSKPSRLWREDQRRWIRFARRSARKLGG
jgi:hypothetical protein